MYSGLTVRTFFAAFKNGGLKQARSPCANVACCVSLYLFRCNKRHAIVASIAVAPILPTPRRRQYGFIADDKIAFVVCSFLSLLKQTTRFLSTEKALTRGAAQRTMAYHAYNLDRFCLYEVAVRNDEWQTARGITIQSFFLNPASAPFFSADDLHTPRV